MQIQKNQTGKTLFSSHNNGEMGPLTYFINKLWVHNTHLVPGDWYNKGFEFEFAFILNE